jgi:hypothetical protein
MTFDKLYVLAKGGVCVYSGSPHELNPYLRECQIVCNEIQVPIEVLLRVASEGVQDEQVRKMANKSLEKRQSILNRCQKEAKLFPDGIEFKSKSFKFIDFWYLLLRIMTETYVSNWKLCLTQLLFHLFFPMIIGKMYSPDIGKPNGCFDFLFNSNTSCYEDLRDNKLLDQNTKFIYAISIFFLFIQLSYTILTFPKEVKIFVNERQNSES